MEQKSNIGKIRLFIATNCGQLILKEFESLTSQLIQIKKASNKCS